LLETCTKCSYFIEENIPPGAQRLAFEVKSISYTSHEYIVGRRSAPLQLSRQAAIEVLINQINGDAFILAVTADACSVVHLVCLFMKTHLPALLQDNGLDLVCCAFLRKLAACVRNIMVFCQHLLRPIYQ